MNITIICIGKLKDKFFKEASSEYEKRLGPFCKLEIIEINPAPLPDSPNEAQIAAGLEKEAELILKKIPPNALGYALCVEGKQLSSEELAAELGAELGAAALSGSGKICFIIGGSHGLAERVKAAANARLSMSKMTFPHRLARIMLLEQIYRAFMINAGTAYHK